MFICACNKHYKKELLIMYTSIYNSPIGSLQLTASEKGLARITFLNSDEVETPVPVQLKDAVKQLDEYFNNQREVFDLPLDIQGTYFQKKIWNVLCKIPYGSTISYKELATKSGSPTAVRAVGGANNRNKLPIVIPCHRVIGIDGSLTGYAGGLNRKKWLLEFEQGFDS